LFVVGLTGDIGAGKSTLIKIWHGLGAHVLDADAAAKRMWQNPDICAEAAERWGDDILEGGGVNFAKIAEKAFADEKEYRYMIGLIHPGTRAQLTREVSALRGWVAAEIPLLFESGGHDWLDCVVYVTAPEEARVARNRARGWSGGEIARRERYLLSSEEKQASADIALRNDGTAEQWADTAREIGAAFLKMASARELTTQCATEQEAREIAGALLDGRLAACVNIAPVTSLYLWNGETEAASEWSLTCKTTESALRGAIACVKARHSYELPAVTVKEYCGGDAATLRWIAESCV